VTPAGRIALAVAVAVAVAVTTIAAAPASADRTKKRRAKHTPTSTSVRIVDLVGDSATATATATATSGTGTGTRTGTATTTGTATSTSTATGTATIDRVASAITETDAAADADAARSEYLVPELRAGSLQARLYGSLRPTIGVAHRETAVERDRWAYGFAGSRIDVGLDVDVGRGVTGSLYVQVAAGRDDVATAGTVDLERALVSYQPIDVLEISVGRDYVPMSAQSATPSEARVFPTRIAIDETFVLPADVGLQVTTSTSLLTAMVGAWNGVATDVMLEPGAEERGLLYSARIEATPLGKLAFDERTRPSSLRLGIGAGATYRAATAFTPTGAAGSRSRDLRAAAAVRVAWRGLFVQGEILRRQITDDLSMRPDVATGGYVQASWRFAAGAVDVAPLARAGIERVRALSAPATGGSLELGGAVFPFARGSDRLSIAALYAHLVDPILGASDEVRAQLRLGF
jgi:hypothetical protein